MKKPIVIDAVLWDGREETIQKIFDMNPKLLEDGVHVNPGLGYVPAFGTLDIHTLEGTMTAQPGDWVICGVERELYPCKPSIFEQTYVELPAED
jgi:hypothetical protein